MVGTQTTLLAALYKRSTDGTNSAPLPMNTTTIRVVHNGGWGLHLHIGFTVQHARHDEVTSRWVIFRALLGQSSPSQWHRQKPRCANFARVKHGLETEQRLSQTHSCPQSLFGVNWHGPLCFE